MGIPLVKTKLLADASGAAFGGTSGVVLGADLNQVTADQFEFSFSIFVLAMIIVGGLGVAAVSTLLLTPVAYLLLAPFSKPKAHEAERLQGELDSANTELLATPAE